MQSKAEAMISRPVPEGITINNHRDPCTLSNYHNFKTTNTALDFHIDFDKKVLKGNVSLRLKSLTEAETNEIVLDTRLNGSPYNNVKLVTNTSSAI